MDNASSLGDSTEAPVFQGRRLLYLVTGSIQAMFMPMWLNWICTRYPETEVRYAITGAAKRFIGISAVSAVGHNGAPLIDSWPDEPEEALHVRLADWPDTILVHPATMNFVTRLSLGLADTPVLLALQCTSAPIVVCPSLPPNGHRNPAYRRCVKELAERDNVTVLPPVSGTSITNAQVGIGVCVPLPGAIVALENLRNRMASQK